MNVYIPMLNQFGTVIGLPSKNKQVQIQVGNSKMYFALEKIEKTNKQKKNTSSFVTSNINSTSQKFSNELNVIGLNVEEAIQIVDKFLDSALISNMKKVRIVHGKGTGKLRNGIHKFLKSNRYVKSFSVAALGDGDIGVTIVELK